MPQNPAQNKLREAGLKVTMPRLKVLEVLDGAELQHLSAEDVYKELLRIDESVGITTIYRILTQFESAGIVQRHNFDESVAGSLRGSRHAVYEMASERHHDHMVDVDSGDVIEFLDDDIEARQREVASSKGYDLVHHEMVLYVKRRGAPRGKDKGAS